MIGLKFIAAGLIVIALLFVGLAVEEAVRYHNDRNPEGEG
jgi:hypothetical protein